MYEVIGYCSALLFFVGYIPQLIRTHRLKSVDDVSLVMWILMAFANITGITYAMSIPSLPLLIGYTLGLYCTVMMLSMFHLYRDPNRDQARRIIREVIRDAKKKFNKG